MTLLLITLVQDVLSFYKREIEPERKIILGWVLLEPRYMLWVVELLYLLLTCWVCLSSQYWINYPGLSKLQVLQILKLKLIKQSIATAERDGIRPQ